MEEYTKNFINFMVDSHVLKFGEFTLKSAKTSPFFMNAGAYKTGSQLSNSASITQEPSTTSTDWILTSCSDLPTREFLWQ